MKAKIYLLSLVLVLGCTRTPLHFVGTPKPEPVAAPAARPASPLEDEYQWLVDGKTEESQAWITAQNAHSQAAFGLSETYEKARKEVLEISQSDAGLPEGVTRGAYYYQVLKGGKAETWRRLLTRDLLAGKDSWETLLNVDLLRAEEKTEWNLVGTHCLAPAYVKCLLTLSVSGGDTVELREFDLDRKAFVADGFRYKQARTQVQWINENEIFIASDFGPNTLTAGEGSYPLQVRIWKRGQPLDSAPVAFASPSSITTGAFLTHAYETPDPIVLLADYVGFRDKVYYLYKDGKFDLKLDLPMDSYIQSRRGNLAALTLKNDWENNGRKFRKGSALVLDMQQALDEKLSAELLFEPAEGEIISAVHSSKSFFWVATLKNAESKLYRFQKKGTSWKAKPVRFPEGGTVTVLDLSLSHDEMFATHENFLSPRSLYYLPNKKLVPKLVTSLPAAFDASEMQAETLWTKSKDGTDVPYFVVQKKETARDGNAPTLLWGYGAGDVNTTPWYLAQQGKVWLSRGGIYVAAVLRGGGEFGPEWRKQGMKENKQNTFDDFTAIAADLSARKITSPAHLGIYGGSWGGLLVTASMVQRPELFGAVVADVPQVDMLAFPLLPGGAGWTGEFGDPNDPTFAEILRAYSPYHQVKADATYPPIYFRSASNDQRVHPAHPRRMAAKMLEQGHEVYYWENLGGGHQGCDGNEDCARVRGTFYSFFAEKLGLKF